MSEHATEMLTGSPVTQPSQGWWTATSGLLEKVGDRLNPILVKETRQALKSRQFTVTFVLLLAVAWGWSMVGLALAGPEVAYGAQQGQTLFAGYYVMLAACLLVIVPFGAFRSLAAEQEERTYEMLCITTLTPAQIVSGKLGSAVLQMLIYLSAISPCLAFTYMLRGIDFPTILFIVFYTFLTSLALSLLGLLVGTLTEVKHWQTVLSVLVVLGLLLAFWTSCRVTLQGVLDFGIAITEKAFWIALSAALTAYASYFALVFFATAAQLTFASDNRSTRLRIIMLVQYLLFAGWMGVAWGATVDLAELSLVFLTVVGLHWYVMGTLMIGESPDLSLRVRRRLPKSFLGRMFLTWFNPGPGTGYLLAVGGMLSALALVALPCVMSFFVPGGIRTPRMSAEVLLAYGVAGFCYLTILLGLGLLLGRLVHRFSPTSSVLSVLFQALLVLLGCGVPLVIQLSSSQWYSSGYTLLQVSNAFWTLTEMARSSGSTQTPAILTILLPCSLLVFVLNLRGIAREVRFVRTAKPPRVAEEDAQQAAKRHPPQPVQISPWDVKLPSEPEP